MGKTTDILERKVIHAGKVFIQQGDENSRAYVIQVGAVKGFVMKGEERIDVAVHGPGDMIGEVNLVSDEPAEINYEAMVDTTVITVTRQDFQKKLARMDKSVKTIINYMTQKLQSQDRYSVDKAFKSSEIDEKSYALTRTFTVNLPPEKQHEYEAAILPHVNGILKAIKELRTKERHAKQAADLEEKIAELTQKISQ